MKRAAWAILVAGALAGSAWAQNVDDGDAPDQGVARLSLMSGDVSIQRGDSGETVAGELNAPLVALDHVLTGPGSRAEVQFDWANMIRLGPVSEVRMGELRDGDYLIQVAEGTTTFRVLRDSVARVEISTPTVSVRPTEKGIYRITVRPDGATEITVRNGQAEIFTPRGTEILRSGKTMEARGTPSDPEFMIVSAISKDDWDRWNEDRDRDLERSKSYQYVSRDIYGADDLDGYGRWTYDSPYGWVWVPNVASTWAPYRVGRWSWVNYYGWTWVSGDPWGWAPYHYGRWYSSPYGWAWYPGATVGYRYYWRPALVGFFGWGNTSIGIGIGNSWGWGNIGWVPLAPYEVYRPWYGPRFRGNTTIVNNYTVVNNTNIVNVYRNARQVNGRNAVTSVNAGTFGRGRVSGDNYVRAGNNDLTRAGQVQGAIPFAGDRDSRRYSDRTPAPDVAARVAGGRDRQFATAASINTDRARRGASAAVAPGAPAGGNADRGGVNRTGRDSAVTDPRAVNPGPTAAPSSNGWRRFEGGTIATPGGGDRANRGADVRGIGSGQARDNVRAIGSGAGTPNAPTDNGRSRRGGTEFAPPAPRTDTPRGSVTSPSAPSAPNVDRGSRGTREFAPPAPRTDAPRAGARTAAPSVPNMDRGSRGGGGTPVQINPPIVRDRGNRGSGGMSMPSPAAPSARPSAPSVRMDRGGGGGAASTPSAPRVSRGGGGGGMSAPAPASRGSMGSVGGSAGGGGGARGGGGGAPAGGGGGRRR